MLARGTRNEHRRAPADVPAFALESLALKAAGPWRVAHENRLARFVGLTRWTGDGEGDRRHDLFDAGHVLVALGDRAVRGLSDGRQDEAVEIEERVQFLAQRSHDRPAVQARGQPPTYRVDDLELPPLIFDGFVAPRIAQDEGHLVGYQLQECGRGSFVRVWARAFDGKGCARGAALFDRDPQRRGRFVDQQRLGVAQHGAGGREFGAAQRYLP